MLVLIVPGWFWGFRKARQLSYVKIIFFPVFWYHDYISRKYAGQPSHIVLKNMGGGKIKKQTPQQMMEEMISSRMPQAKEKKDLNSSKIRSNFEQKNRKFHEKMESGDSWPEDVKHLLTIFRLQWLKTLWRFNWSPYWYWPESLLSACCGVFSSWKAYG